jgi:hypothetical protein
MFHQHRRRGMRNVLALLVLAHALCAQKPEWWVHQALRQNPTLAALQARWQAASQRIVPGMTPADPMLMLGVANFPPRCVAPFRANGDADARAGANACLAYHLHLARGRSLR